MKKIIIPLIILIATVGALLAGATPSVVRYQGSLLYHGLAFTGTQTMRFMITNSDGSSVYWDSLDVSVAVTNGSFSYPLNVSGVNWNTPPSGGYYLQISVNGQLLLPREGLASNIYSLQAQNVDDGAISMQKLSAAVQAKINTSTGGDNLGNHIATTTLNMSNFNIANAATVTANKVAVSTFTMATGATAGYVLTCDSAGNGFWQLASTFSVKGLLSSTNTWTGANTWTAPNTWNGSGEFLSNVGIAGKATVGGLTMPTGASAGYVLTSADNSGNAVWTANTPGTNLLVATNTWTAPQAWLSTGTFNNTQTFVKGINTSTITITGGAQVAGYVLTNDGTGNGVWQANTPSSDLRNSTNTWTAPQTWLSTGTFNNTQTFAGGINASTITVTSVSGFEDTITEDYGIFTSTIEVNGQSTFDDTLTADQGINTSTITITGGAQVAGYVLTNDGTGNGVWQANTPSSDLRNSTNTWTAPQTWLSSGTYTGTQYYNNGINTSSITISGGANSGYVLTSNANGYATWSAAVSSAGYSVNAGTATWAVSAGTAAYSAYSLNAGTSSYSVNATTATWVLNTASTTYALSAGTATWSVNAGTSTYTSYAVNSGTAAYATYAVNSGTSTYAVNAGTAAYASNATGSLLLEMTNLSISTGAIAAQLGGIYGTTSTWTAPQAFTSSMTVNNNLAVSGNVGIGTASPNYNLDVAGNGNFSGGVTVSSVTLGSQGAIIATDSTGENIQLPDNDLDMNNNQILNVADLQIPTGAQNGYVLMSDSSGYASWQSVTSTSGVLTAILNSTNTWNAPQTFNSSTTMNNSLSIERTVNDNGVILHLGNALNGGNGFDFSREALTGTLSLQGEQSGYNNIVLAPTSGNVGIGTTSPNYNLDVAGNGNFSGGVTVSSVTVGSQGAVITTDSTGENIQFPNNDLDMNNNQILNIADLQIPTGAQNGYVLMSDSSGYASWQSVTSTSGVLTAILSSTNTWTAPQTFNSSTTMDNSLTVSGKVGVGTTIPNTELTVVGPDWYSSQLSVGDGAFSPSYQMFVAMTNENGGTGYIQTIQQGTGYNQNLALQPIGGKVGIGTTSPSYTLDVAGSGNFSGGVTVSSVTVGSQDAIIATDSTGENIQFETDLDMNGNNILNVENIQIASATAVNGYVLTSDAKGNGSWQSVGTNLLNVANTWTAPQTYASSSTYNNTIEMKNNNIVDVSTMTFSGAGITWELVDPSSYPAIVLLNDLDMVYNDIYNVTTLNFIDGLGGTENISSEAYDAWDNPAIAFGSDLDMDNFSICNVDNIITSGIQLYNGRAKVGYVLTATDTTGDATWESIGTNLLNSTQTWTAAQTFVGSTTFSGLVKISTVNAYAVTCSTFEMTNGAVNGYILSSDGTGHAMWVSSGIVAGSVLSGALGSGVIASSIAVNSVYPSAVNTGTYSNITLPAANVASGTLGASVIASSIAVNSVYPSAVNTGTYSNITLPAANVASGTLGASVIASSIAVNSVYPSAVNTGTYSNITLPAANVAAGSLGASVIVSSIAANAVYPSGIASGTLPSNVIASSIAVNSVYPAAVLSGTYSNITVPAANVASGSLGASVIASSIAVNSVYPAAVLSGTYSNVTVPAANVASGSLGAGVIASSIAVNSVYPSAVSAGTYSNVIVSSLTTGTYSNVSIPAANVNAGTLGSTVIASSIAVNSVYPEAVLSGTYSNVTVPAANVASGSLGTNVIASSIAVNSVYPAAVLSGTYSNVTIPAANVASGTLGTNVIASSIAVNSVYPSAVSAGTYTGVIVSSLTTGTYSNVSIPAANVNAGSLGSSVIISSIASTTNPTLAGLTNAGNENISGTLTVTSSATFNNTVGVNGNIISTGTITDAGETVTGSSFSVGGSTLVVTSGKVGIGTASPSSILHLYNATTSPSLILQYGAGSGSAAEGQITTYHSSQAAYSGYISLEPYYYNGSAYAFRSGTFVVDASGDVGIGTASPGYVLEVNGNTMSDKELYVNNSATGIDSDGSSLYLKAAGNTYLNGAASAYITNTGGETLGGTLNMNGQNITNLRMSYGNTAANCIYIASKTGITTPSTIWFDTALPWAIGSARMCIAMVQCTGAQYGSPQRGCAMLSNLDGGGSYNQWYATFIAGTSVSAVSVSNNGSGYLRVTWTVAADSGLNTGQMVLLFY